MLKKIIGYWLPPLIWMIVIFLLSSRERIITTRSFFLDFIIYKTFHMIEYGFLFFLVFRGLHSINHQSISLKDKLILSLLISIGYAISDEIHQTYSLFREGRLRDVVIDTVGITIMYIYIKNNLRLLKKFLWIKS